MVCTRCMTYNHASYIEDTLNGFSSQETSFPVVFAIVDDASTDGAPELLRQWCANNLALNEVGIAYTKSFEYGELLYARHKEHKNQFYALLLLSYNHYSKRLFDLKLKYIHEWMYYSRYLALCEGDDYWIDPNKLQKQVDFLDENNDYSLCFSNAKLLNVNNLPCAIDIGHVEDRTYYPDEFFKQWLAPTASIIYRKEVEDVQLIKPERLMFGDIILLLKAAKTGLIRGMSDEMTVYRLNSGSVTQNPDYEYKLVMKRPEFVEFIIDNFGDILDKDYLYKGLCKRYCYRSLIQPTRDAKYNDLLAASKINKVITLKFVFRNIVLMGFRAMFKIIRGR